MLFSWLTCWWFCLGTGRRRQSSSCSSGPTTFSRQHEHRQQASCAHPCTIEYLCPYFEYVMLLKWEICHFFMKVFGVILLLISNSWVLNSDKYYIMYLCIARSLLPTYMSNKNFFSEVVHFFRSTSFFTEVLECIIFRSI